MKTRVPLLAALLIWLATTGLLSAAEPTVSVLHCGTLLAVPGQSPRSEVSVLVRGGRIEAVKRGYVEAGSVELAPDESLAVVDLKGHVCLPGLVDAHTHITSEYTADVRLRRVQSSDADAALRGAVYARRTLDAGFTTIRNVGSSGDAVFALRDAIEQGWAVGPRILAAGESLSPTGGHSDGTHGYREDLFDIPGAFEGIADGPFEARKAVRAQIKRGADVIKLTATGGVLSAIASGTGQQFFADELEAIVETAHQLGKKVAAHAHGADGIAAALRAGVDSIEHGTFLDETAIALFLETGAWYVPTIIAGKTVEARAKQPGFFPEAVAEKARRVGPQIQGAFERAYKGGVKIAFGTDSGVSAHGDNAQEFVYMAEAGMKPMEAIVSATLSAAELLGLADRIGSIEQGKDADIIATARNPLVDLTELQRIAFVMRAGIVYKRP